MPNKRVQKKFVNGVYKIYSKMFTDDIIFRTLLSEADGTKKNNVYNEGVLKKYSEPIYLVGKEILEVKEGETTLERNKTTATFDFPYKTFLENDVDISIENHSVICQGVIEYLGQTYEIEKITPKTFVAGVFLFYRFECKTKVIQYA